MIQYYSAIEKNEILPIEATWMEVEGITLGEICQTKKSTMYHMLLSLFSLSDSVRPHGSPPGSPVPGILQARTLEWIAISFSNA